MDVPAVPDAPTRGRLLAWLAEYVASGGAGPLLAPPIAPARAAFPERLRPTGAGGVDIDGRDLERGSVAAVYLGLGVLAANAAYQQYTSSGRTNGAYMPLEYDVIKSGHLTMSELAFLLAVQAVARGEHEPPHG